MDDNLSILLNSIQTMKTGIGNRFILGVDGLSRSGKTTFVNKLSHMLQEKNIPICVFHMDDYIVECNKRYDTEHEEWYEYYHLQWDVEWLQENLFNKLKESNQLNLPLYNNDSDHHSIQSINIPDTCIVLIEGVFLQRKEWRAFYDYLVYMDCPRSEGFLVKMNPLKRTLKNLETGIGRQKTII